MYPFGLFTVILVLSFLVEVVAVILLSLWFISIVFGKNRDYEGEENRQRMKWEENIDDETSEENGNENSAVMDSEDEGEE